MYSGFVTRSWEAEYNLCVCELLGAMQRFIVGFLKASMGFQFKVFGEEFCDGLDRMSKLEKQKRLEPNFSLYLKDLESFFRDSGVRVLPKSKERVGFLESFNEMSQKQPDAFRKTVKKVENEKSKGRHRDEFPATTRESPRFFRRDKKIQMYQDRILNCINKELILDC